MMTLRSRLRKTTSWSFLGDPLRNGVLARSRIPILLGRNPLTQGLEEQIHFKRFDFRFFPSAILNLNPDEEVDPSSVVLPSEPLLNETVVALHPYHSTEPGDLIFDEGQKLRVVVKNSEWWTGQFGEKLGVFPSNYVAPEVRGFLLHM